MTRPKHMLSSVQTTLSVKEEKYLSSNINNFFYDLTDHRGQGNPTIITWDLLIGIIATLFQDFGITQWERV